MLNKINKFFDHNAYLIFIVFLYLQPVIDIMTGVMLNYFNSSFILSFILKIAFLLFMLYYICFIKKKKLKYIIIIFIYCLCFLLTNLFFKGKASIFIELENLIKVIYLPISFIFVSQLLKEREFKIKHLYIILGIYMLFIFIPNLFHLGFKSYSYAKLGSVGLFYSANAIGSILSFLFPIMLSFFINKKYKKSLIVFLGVYLLIILKMGTKIPIVCIIFVIIYYLILMVTYLIKNNKKRYLIGLILILLIGIVCIIKILPSTEFYKNLVIHLNFLKIKSFSDLLTFKNIDHFIFSSRLKFLRHSFKLYFSSSFLQKIFGLGYIMDGKALKTSEMDFFVTLIHQGIIGFIVIYFMYFKYIFLIIKKYFSNFKVNFYNIELSSFVLSAFISGFCAFFSGHVLDVPSISIFVVLIVLILYFKLEKNVKTKK